MIIPNRVLWRIVFFLQEVASTISYKIILNKHIDTSSRVEYDVQRVRSL